MADSIGNLYTGSLLDSNFKQITDNDYDVYLGPGEYYALIDYSEGVDVKVPISIQVPDETPVLTDMKQLVNYREFTTGNVSMQ